MQTSRMEAFSDGVFAIAITILVLELKVPQVEPGGLLQAVRADLPKLGAFLLSFVIIGTYWISHHQMVHFVKEVDRTSLWLNLANLAVICFLPYPSGILGEYPLHPLAIQLYGFTLCLVNLTGALFWWWTMGKAANSQVVGNRGRKLVTAVHLAPVGVYGASMVLARVWMPASYALLAAVPLFFMVPNPLLARILRKVAG